MKRVTLPDGRQLDVVYFEDGKEKSRDWGSPGLHICAECSCGMVYPIEWDQVDPGLWAVTVRCPNCEEIRSGIFDQNTVEQFDEELDSGLDKLIDDMRRLERANMEGDVERFARALSQDQILPIDF